MKIISNSFSLGMLPFDSGSIVAVRPATDDDIKQFDNCYSTVGHADTAAVFTGLLGWDVPMNRANLKLQQGDTLLVGQLTGGRLPEGTTTLPDGFNITWLLVEVL